MSRKKNSQIVPVMVELRIAGGTETEAVIQAARGLRVGSFRLDDEYTPVPVRPMADHAQMLEEAGEEAYIVRGIIKEADIPELENHPTVLKVWTDTPIEPFTEPCTGDQPWPIFPAEKKGPCPIPPCDCSFGDPAVGDIGAVAAYLGVNEIWNHGIRGSGIVIGIVDGGITAIGRPVKPGEIERIPRVIGGWPNDWGTTAAAWQEHGNMTSWDALGMAPEAQLYDIRISNPSHRPHLLSNPLSGYQWTIEQHRFDGTPQILSNSWGIYRREQNPDYAVNPTNPFTRKVEEALNEGILVLFSAGNCGQTCPDSRCFSDNGPGRSIWGANGHPKVMTVGAANLHDQWVGYSSQGPAALSSRKPDFCSPTHFAGYFPNINPDLSSDRGTSAAAPIVAGVVALLKEKFPDLTQDLVKNALMATAKDIGPEGWDSHSGSGIIQAKAAYDYLSGTVPPISRQAWSIKDLGPISHRVNLIKLERRSITEGTLIRTNGAFPAFHSYRCKYVVDPGDSSLWFVTGKEGFLPDLIKVRLDGSSLLRKKLGGDSLYLDIDKTTHSLWIVGASPYIKILKFSITSETLTEVSNYYYVTSLLTDPFRGGCWVGARGLKGMDPMKEGIYYIAPDTSVVPFTEEVRAALWMNLTADGDFLCCAVLGQTNFLVRLNAAGDIVRTAPFDVKAGFFDLLYDAKTNACFLGSPKEVRCLDLEFKEKFRIPISRFYGDKFTSIASDPYREGIFVGGEYVKQRGFFWGRISGSGGVSTIASSRYPVMVKAIPEGLSC